MSDIKEKLYQILEIIQLPEKQRDEVVIGIIELTNEYTLLQLLEKLSREDQLRFKGIIRQQQNKPEFILSFIKKYYATETIEQAVYSEAKKLICDYLHTLSPMISQEEKDQINNILEDCFE